MSITPHIQPNMPPERRQEPSPPLFVAHLAFAGGDGPPPEHIRHVRDLAAALDQHPAVAQQVIITRTSARSFGLRHGALIERLSPRLVVWRCRGFQRGIVSADDLWSELDTLGKDVIARLQTLATAPDVLHAHFPDAGAVAARVKRVLGLPLLYTPHSHGGATAEAGTVDTTAGTSPSSQRQARSHAEAQSRAAADLVIANSPQECRLAPDAPAPQGQVSVNPPGYDLPPFGQHAPPLDRQTARALRDQLRAPGLRPLLVPAHTHHHGGFIRRLLQAYASTPNLRRSVNLLLLVEPTPLSDAAQAGSPQQEMADHLRSLGLTGHTALLTQGSREQTAALLAYIKDRRGALVDSGPHANPRETLPRVLMEAALAGVPIACEQAPAAELAPAELHPMPREQSPPLPMLCSENLLEAVAALLTGETTWMRYSQAVQDAGQAFTWSRHAERYVAACRTLVTKPEPAAVHDASGTEDPV